MAGQTSSGLRLPVSKYFAQRLAAVDGGVTGPLCQLLGTAHVHNAYFSCGAKPLLPSTICAWLLLCIEVGTDSNWLDEKSVGTYL